VKLFIVIPSFRGGGAERAMINIANGLVEYGVKIKFIVFNDEGPYKNDLSLSIETVNLGCNKATKSIFPLMALLKAEQPDILFSTLRHVNFICICAKYLSNVRTKVIVREATSMDPNQYKNWLIRISYKLLLRTLYRQSDLVIAVSNGVKDSLLNRARISNSKIKVINNPVLTKDFWEKSKLSVKHDWFASNRRWFTILAVGRLVPAKDYPTLIKAFKIICNKGISVRLAILGEGYLRSELENLIKELELEENIALLGFKSNPFKFMKESDLFVLSSAWEGLPNALIQALSLGVTVVSTDCKSGPSEVLLNGKLGRLVPIGNPGKLAEAMEQSLLRPQKVSYEKISRYESKTVCKVYMETFREIMKVI
jgi:glycosyltransferase involved in cell wall biosynthesis